MSEQDSHISTGAKAVTPPGPLNMHQRNKLGEKVNGQTNPNGAASGPTDNKVGNAPCQY